MIFGAIIFEYVLRTQDVNFLLYYLVWGIVFFSNTYFGKIALEISDTRGLQKVQKKSQKFLGKFSRYIRWDGTITAIIFHVCLFAEHLEWIIIPFIVWHGLLSAMGASSVFQKLYRKNGKNL